MLDLCLLTVEAFVRTAQPESTPLLTNLSAFSVPKESFPRQRRTNARIVPLVPTQAPLKQRTLARLARLASTLSMTEAILALSVLRGSMHPLHWVRLYAQIAMQGSTASRTRRAVSTNLVRIAPVGNSAMKGVPPAFLVQPVSIPS